MTTELARGRTIRCMEEERARIEARAEAAGMTVSAFVMACALQDDGVATLVRLGMEPGGDGADSGT